MSSDNKKEEISPEERLLKVIQQGKNAATPAPSTPAAVPKKETPSVAAMPPAPAPVVNETAPQPPPAKLKLAEKPAEKETVVPAAAPVAASAPAVGAEEKPEVVPAPKESTPSFLIDKAESGFATKGVQGLILTNRVLLGIVCLALIFVVIDFVMARVVSPAGPAESGAVVLTASDMPKPMLLEPLDNFNRKIGSRNVFFATAPAASTGNKTGTPTPAVAENIKNFKLMGVSIDPTTVEESMVILSDAKSGKTYFVKVGQRIGETDMSVAKVYADHVTIKNQKEEMELR